MLSGAVRQDKVYLQGGIYCQNRLTQLQKLKYVISHTTLA